MEVELELELKETKEELAQKAAELAGAQQQLISLRAALLAARDEVSAANEVAAAARADAATLAPRGEAAWRVDAMATRVAAGQAPPLAEALGLRERAVEGARGSTGAPPNKVAGGDSNT